MSRTETATGFFCCFATLPAVAALGVADFCLGTMTGRGFLPPVDLRALFLARPIQTVERGISTISNF